MTFFWPTHTAQTPQQLQAIENSHVGARNQTQAIITLNLSSLIKILKTKINVVYPLQKTFIAVLKNISEADVEQKSQVQGLQFKV